MKKIVILGIVTVLLLSLGVVSFTTVVKPPPGEHYTFNCVTEEDPILGLGENEILVPLNGSGMLGYKIGPTFEILDNDMIDDGQAWFQIPAGYYDTFAQARGKPGGDLTWGKNYVRLTGKPVWVQHNANAHFQQESNFGFTNSGVTCYSFRFYPL